MKVMDKTVTFVCLMLSIVTIFSFVELLITSDIQWAISVITLLWAILYITFTYPKNRKDYS